MKAKHGFSFALLFALTSLFMGACKEDDDDNIDLREFSATLTAAAGVTTIATGTFTATYDEDDNRLSYTLSWNGFVATAAHLHNKSNPNEIVPLSVTSTSISPVTGTVTLTEEEESLLMDEEYYVNVHSAAYPDGEIQGDLNER